MTTSVNAKKNNTGWRTVWLHRVTGSILIAALTIVLLSASVSLARVLWHTTALRYVAYVTANPAPGACYDMIGLYTGLQAQLPKRPKTANELKKLAATNTPHDAIVEISKKVYRLNLNVKTSAYGNEQIGWNFKLVRLDKASALSLIGKRAVIRYRIGSQMITTSSTVVADGRCKSLI